MCAAVLWVPESRQRSGAGRHDDVMHGSAYIYCLLVLILDLSLSDLKFFLISRTNNKQSGPAVRSLDQWIMSDEVPDFILIKLISTDLLKNPFHKVAIKLQDTKREHALHLIIL